ncbi:hypothetical protein MIMGU_mgv1a023731mg [Erythranthe guttata]|uniref:Uncharacterized protein n=1 Tax=Erythranthe guttata TaxID=4155 RepID=A0A022RVU3_ERYGU|nr:hypothetical protein MIMGU_mgv1a023731mg [Erythranthe guttata]
MWSSKRWEEQRRPAQGRGEAAAQGGGGAAAQDGGGSEQRRRQRKEVRGAAAQGGGGAAATAQGGEESNGGDGGLWPKISAQNYGCFKNETYVSNSTFDNNLRALLSSLSSNMNDTGFYRAYVGRIPNRAYATALCRTDVQLDSCRSCVREASVEIANLCVNRKQSVMRKGTCTLRYSDEPIFGVRADVFCTKLLLEGTGVSNPDQFRQARGLLMDGLREEAASGGNLMKVAAGNRTVSDFQTIFALLQCTPDISSEECDACLVEADRQISECCDSGGSVKILTISCNLRYEIGPFYNISRIQEARAIISPPPPPPPVPTVPAPAPAPADSSDPPMPLLASPPPMPLLSPPLPDDDDNSSEFQKYDFATIRAATDNFSIANKLGQGGFGVVYKGKLKNDEEIAVKRLSMRSQQGDSQFNNEVLLVAKLQHRNLVRLLGFAQEGTERLLVYEFVENGSLDRYIFDPTRHCEIDWKMRQKIIEGIAKGLVYLHEDSRLRVIHRDLKAANILLDAEMNPKIADFGLARLFPRDESLLGNTGTIVGTRGYIAPEYARRGELSVKLDVYSFGVLVLEIVRGRNNNSFPNKENSETMLSFAWRNWREGTPEAMIDPTLTTTCSGSYMREILRCIHIGLLCVQENAIERPIMASVVQLLNNVSTTLSEPLQPAFFVPNSRDMELKKRKDQSINEASITELYPR